MLNYGILLQYIRIEYKRAFAAMRSMLLASCVLLLAVAAGSVAITQVMKHLTAFEKITVAMVLPKSQQTGTLHTFSELISTQESVSNICDFVYMDEKKAVEAMHEGSAQAAIIFGETFMYDVMNGINTPATVLLPEDSTIFTDTFREEVSDGISLIRTGEAAIYSTTEVGLSAVPMIIERGDMENFLTQLFSVAALSRDSFFSSEEVSAYGENSVVQYYAAAGLTVFLVFFGMVFGSMYTRSDIAVRKKMRVAGPGAVSGSLIRIVVMTTILLLVSCLFAALMNVYGTAGGDSIMAKDWAESFPVLILTCFSIACFFHFIYSITGEGTQNIMILLLSGVFMTLLSGILFPAVFLPDLLQSLSTYMPESLWRTGITDFICGRLSAKTAASELIVAVLFGTGGVLCTMNKIRA
jgi:hypothetical protein